MQSRRGFFGTLLAAAAGALAKVPASIAPWRAVDMESTFMYVPREPLEWLPARPAPTAAQSFFVARVRDMLRKRS